MAKHSLHELAAVADATLEGDRSIEIRGTASLREARAGEISFCALPAYTAEVESTRASAVIVPADWKGTRTDLALLRTSDVNRAFTRICALFAGERARPAPGTHPSAVVDPTAKLGPGVAIGPLCVVGARAEIGAAAVLHAQVFVGEDVRVGEHTEVHPGAVFYSGVRIGARCLVHAGAVIGSDGFGFEPPKSAGEPWTKIPQSGTVVVEDDVEIGANTAIDRARFGTTWIRRGVKLDNLIQIGHNCDIGPGSMLAAHAGIGGSTNVGRGVMIGGQAGIAGHVTIGDGARLAAQSGVKDDIPPGGDWFGAPARPAREAFKLHALLDRLPLLVERVRELEKRISELDPSRKEAQP